MAVIELPLEARNDRVRGGQMTDAGTASHALDVLGVR
jgi:hypothetical protein